MLSLSLLTVLIVMATACVPPRTPTPEYVDDLGAIKGYDQGIRDLIVSQPWFLDGVDNNEALFIKGIRDIVANKVRMSEREKGLTYLTEVIVNAPHTYIVDEVRLQNGPLPLLITSQNAELLSKAVSLVKAGMPRIQEASAVDYPTQTVRVHLGAYGLAIGSARSGYIILPETEDPTRYYHELTHTFQNPMWDIYPAVPLWWLEGRARFIQYYVAEQVKGDPWWDELRLPQWLRQGETSSIVDDACQMAEKEYEARGLSNVPLVKSDAQGDPYLQGHLFWMDLYRMLGSRGTAEVFALSWANSAPTEKDLETVSLKVASKYGKEELVKELFGSRVFGPN